MSVAPVTDQDLLATYLPGVVAQWRTADGGSRLISAEGTLLSADISGFTALSERLASLGHEGAEELTDLLNTCFTEMIDAASAGGGDVIKFGGDALLILFSGAGHARRAAVAMARMRAIVAQSWSTNTVAKVDLGISQGAHSGVFHFTLVDGGHLELVVCGPGVSRTVQCESDAGRGVILVTAEMAAQLPPEWLHDDPDESGAVRLRHRRILNSDPEDVIDLVGPPRVDGLGAHLPAALVDQILVDSPGEHRQVSVAFVSVSGTDELCEREGPEALLAAFDQVAANVRSVLADHHVHWMATDAYVNGTKLIFSAGAPTSTDSDEDHMLLALRALVSLPSPLPMRIGVNQGHVYVGDLGAPSRRTFTIMGDAVNLAARLMGKAEVGQVVASRRILDRSNTTFALEELEPFYVKGKSMPIEAAVVGDAVEVDEADEPAVEDRHLSHVPFVGRAEELALLETAANDALAGRGRLVEVVGEAGIGKSRLIDEALSQHPGLTRLVLRGGQYARNTPYFVIRRLLHTVMGADRSMDPAQLGRTLTAWITEHAPELVPWLPLLAVAFGAEVAPTPEVDRLADEFRRERLIEVVSAALEATSGDPVAIMAEDAYWFDEASLDVLRVLGRRVDRHPWLILVTLRPEAPRVLDGAGPGTVIELESLSADDGVALAEAASELADGLGLDIDIASLAERGGGHPLFVLELIASAADTDGSDLPESIESLVTTRIDTLSPADRLLLREAAVSGAVVDVDLLADALGDPGLRRGERWSGLDDFLEPEGPARYRFRHAMYQGVAYEGLAYRRRREVHMRVGDAIERRAGERTSLVSPLLSLHFDRGRDQRRAYHYSVMAGDDARSTYANSEAITFYERALANAAGRDDSGDADGESAVAERLADVLSLAGRYDSAFDALQRSRRSLHHDTASAVRLLRKLGRVRQRQANFSQALRWCSRALKALPSIDDPAERAREEAEVALIRAGTLHRQGRNSMSVEWAEHAAEAAERAGDRLAMASSYTILEVAYRTLGDPRAHACGERALELYQGTGDLVGEANVLNNIGVRAHFDGDWRLAESSYERSRELREQAGDVVGEALVANNLGEIHLLRGAYDRAIALFEHARAAWERSGYQLGVAYASANLAVARARGGDVAEGMRLLESAAQMFSDLGAAALRLEAEVRHIECLLLADKPDEAFAEASGLEHRLVVEHDGDEDLLLELGPLLGIAQVRVGQVEQGRRELEGLRDRAHARGNAYLEALALLGAAESHPAHSAERAAAVAAGDALFESMGLLSRPPVLTAATDRPST